MKIKLDPGAYLPTRAHDTDAGLDLYAPRDVIVPPHSSAVIDTGVHVQLPPNTYGKIEGKSGLNIKRSIVSLGGVIDEGYTGSVHVKMYNLGHEPYMFAKGDKVVQMLVCPVLYEHVEEVDMLDESERGDAGFGSTGK